MGGTIAMSFAAAMALGPVLGSAFGVPSLFYITAGLALLAMVMLFTKVPTPPKIRHTYHKKSSETAFAYLIHAHAKDYPYRRPERIDLRNANVQGWKIGSEQAPLFDLTATCFAGADLQETVFHNTDLSGADFSGVSAKMVEMHQVTAEECNWRKADLFASLWRLSTLTGGQWDRARLEESQLIRCTINTISWPGKVLQSIQFADCRFLPTRPALYKDPDVLAANPFMGKLYDVFVNAVPRPSAQTKQKYNQVSSAFWTAVHNVLIGQTDAATSLRMLEQQLKRIKGRGW